MIGPKVARQMGDDFMSKLLFAAHPFQKLRLERRHGADTRHAICRCAARIVGHSWVLLWHVPPTCRKTKGFPRQARAAFHQTEAGQRQWNHGEILGRFGGGYRNRTDLHGFAIQRIACLPTRRPDASCRQGRGERQADKRRLRPDKTRDTTRQRRAFRRAHRWLDSRRSGGSEGLHRPMLRAHRLVASAGNCGLRCGP